MITPIIRTLTLLRSIVEQIKAVKVFSYDFETTGLDTETTTIVGLGLAWFEGTITEEAEPLSCYIPIAHSVGQNIDAQNKYEVANILAPLFMDPDNTAVAWNAKFDERILRYNLKIQVDCKIWDGLIADWLENPEGRHGLKEATGKIFGADQMKMETVLRGATSLAYVQPELVAQYCGSDAIWTIKHYRRQVKLIEEKQLTKEMVELEMPFVRCLMEMERNGAKIDTDYLYMLTEETEDRLDEIIDEFAKLIGKRIGLGATKDLEIALWDTLKAPKWDKMERTTKGISTKHSQLEELDARGFEPVKLVLEYRILDKLQNTYHVPLRLLAMKCPLHRIYASFLQTGTITGRMSCSNPNLQQVPRRSPQGKRIRKAFIAESGWQLIRVDMSQVELRLFAHFSQDPIMIKTFLEGGDIHAETMEAASCNRDNAKIINFGLIYAMWITSLAKKLGVDYTTAENFYNGFHGRFVGVKQFHASTLRYLETHGYVRTLLGRYRYLPDIRSEDKWVREGALREGVNTMIQGCLDGDRRIWIRGKGMKRIADSIGPVQVWDGKRFVSGEVVASGLKRLVTLTFWNGKVFKCSPDHRFLVQLTNGRLSWKSAIEISRQKNVRVVISEGINDEGAQACSFPSSVSKTHWKALNGIWNFQNLSWGDWTNNRKCGELLGRLVSDGSYSSKIGTIVWLFAEHEYDLVDPIERLIAEVKSPVRTTKLRENKQSMKELRICSKGLTRALDEMQIKKAVPNQIFSNREMLAGFLSGLFDGDGGMVGDSILLTFGKGPDHYLPYAQSVQTALSVFGVQSRVRSYKDRVVVCVTRKSNQIFEKEIGFLSRAKIEKLAASLQAKRKVSINTERVKSVEFSEEEVPMFDVVDTDSGQFMADGLVVHNSNADVMKVSQRNIQRWINSYKLQDRLKICIQVHDELVLECRNDFLGEALPRIKYEMENAVKLRVPLKVEPEYGPSWGEKKPWTNDDPIPFESEFSKLKAEGKVDLIRKSRPGQLSFEGI